MGTTTYFKEHLGGEVGKLPVLVLAYNRPDLTRALFGHLSAYKPQRLYVACDGPQGSKPSDRELVSRVRSHLSEPSWKTELHTRFSSEHHGLRNSVEGAISWFFTKEPEGIILEDDCHPTPDFFRFVEHILEKYRENDTVWGVTGSNEAGLTFSGNASYGFIRYPVIWGWASWANRWEKHDTTLHSYGHHKTALGVGGWPSREHKLSLKRHLDSIWSRGVPDTWDYPFAWSVISNNGTWVVPRNHLVRNVGFRNDATHTRRRFFPERRIEMLGDILPPGEDSVDVKAEKEFFVKLHFLRRPLWLNYPVNLLKIAKSRAAGFFERIQS